MHDFLLASKFSKSNFSGCYLNLRYALKVLPQKLFFSEFGFLLLPNDPLQRKFVNQVFFFLEYVIIPLSYQLCTNHFKFELRSSMTLGFSFLIMKTCPLSKWLITILLFIRGTLAFQDINNKQHVFFQNISS